MGAVRSRQGLRIPRRDARSPVLRAVGSLGLIVFLTGCAGLSGAPASVALSEAQGYPADAPVGEPHLDAPGFDEGWRGEPLGWLADDRATLTIVSFGSSACPYIATSITVVDDLTVEIELRQGPAQACTDDLAPRTHVLATPEGWGTGEGPYSAQVTRRPDAFGAGEPLLSTVELWPPPNASTIAVQTLRGVPDDVTLPDDALDSGEPLAFWGAGRQSLRVITWGSSSCPPPALSLIAGPADVLTLVFGALPPVACTADFGPTTHVLGVPGGVGEGPVTLEITLKQRGADSMRFSVPIVD